VVHWPMDGMVLVRLPVSSHIGQISILSASMASALGALAELIRLCTATPYMRVRLADSTSTTVYLSLCRPPPPQLLQTTRVRMRALALAADQDSGTDFTHYI
jgi:hypothetical protein